MAIAKRIVYTRALYVKLLLETLNYCTLFPYSLKVQGSKSNKAVRPQRPYRKLHEASNYRLKHPSWQYMLENFFRNLSVEIRKTDHRPY